MDISYRIDTAPDMYPADLDSTWLGGEVCYNNNNNNKVKPPPLNTDRLKVFRQVTRGATLSILETGHVSIEFLKKKGDQDRLAELFVISGDGQEICVEQWKTDVSHMGSDFTAHTVDIEKTWKTFTYNSLPEKYWKKYSHACRFVDLVKSKTAKVTMYSDRTKGVLMENRPPNFEATFFQGPKILMCGSEVHIKEDSGASLMFHRDSLNTLVNNYTLGLIQHATQMREQCVRLEASVMTVQAMSHNSEPLFPVTVGMRPSTSFCSSTSSNSGSIDLLSSPRFGHLHSSSSGSQGHPASPPSSPSPQIDLRCLDSSRLHTPTSHPSSVDVKTSQSPFRHISTLEGRKFRCQLSDSTDSSYLQHSNSQPAAGTSPDLYTTSPCVQNAEQQQEAISQGLADSFSGIQHSQSLLPDSLRSSEELRQIKQLFIVPPVTSASPQQVRPLFSSPQQSHTSCNNIGHTQTRSSLEEVQGRPLTKQNVSSLPGRETTAEEAMPVPCLDTQSEPTLDMKKKIPNADRDSENDMSAVVRQTFVPYTGWASQLANGTIWIHYNEGTQLGVYGDKPEVVYEDQQGNRYRYLQSDNIPEVVRQKLERLPTVIENLKRKPSTSLNTLAST